jgi:hypothetical protein
MVLHAVTRRGLAALFAVLLLAPARAFDQPAAVRFIDSLYDPSKRLVKECPTCSLYWLWSDNFLAQIVLRKAAPEHAAAIEQAMNGYGITMRSGWATFDPRYRAKTSFRGAADKTVPGTGTIRYSDYDGASALSCADYADVAFLTAIHRYRTGDIAGARTCYALGKAKWDGTGFHERWEVKGSYAVYKTALGLLAEKITGCASIGIPQSYFDRYQGADGGVRTDVVDGRPAGLENVETTAAVVLAQDPSLLPRTAK